MKGAILILLLLSWLLKCTIGTDDSQRAGRIITYLNCDTLNFSDHSIKVDKDSVDIMFFENFKIFKVRKIVYRDYIDKTRGDTIETAFINPDTTYNFFVFEKGHDWGLRYWGGNSTLLGKFPNDSLLKELGLHKSMLEVYNLSLGKPASIENKNNIKIEKYLNKKLDKSDSDSIYRYFNKKLKDIDLSLSPELDKRENSKLCRTSFVNIYPSKGEKKEIVREEYYSEIKENTSSSSAEFVKVFDKFKVDRKKMKLN